MGARIILRKAWVAFGFGVLFEMLYLSSETLLVAVWADYLVAITLFASGAGVGIWLDGFVARSLAPLRLRMRQRHLADA